MSWCRISRINQRPQNNELRTLLGSLIRSRSKRSEERSQICLRSRRIKSPQKLPKQRQNWINQLQSSQAMRGFMKYSDLKSIYPKGKLNLKHLMCHKPRPRIQRIIQLPTASWSSSGIVIRKVASISKITIRSTAQW